MNLLNCLPYCLFKSKWKQYKTNFLESNWSSSFFKNECVSVDESQCIRALKTFLPDPVGPYANMQALPPSITLEIMGRAQES